MHLFVLPTNFFSVHRLFVTARWFPFSDLTPFLHIPLYHRIQNDYFVWTILVYYVAVLLLWHIYACLSKCWYFLLSVSFYKFLPISLFLPSWRMVLMYTNLPDNHRKRFRPYPTEKLSETWQTYEFEHTIRQTLIFLQKFINLFKRNCSLPSLFVRLLIHDNCGGYLFVFIVFSSWKQIIIKCCCKYWISRSCRIANRKFF